MPNQSLLQTPHTRMVGHRGCATATSIKCGVAVLDVVPPELDLFRRSSNGPARRVNARRLGDGPALHLHAALVPTHRHAIAHTLRSNADRCLAGVFAVFLLVVGELGFQHSAEFGHTMVWLIWIGILLAWAFSGANTIPGGVAGSIPPTWRKDFLCSSSGIPLGDGWSPARTLGEATP